MRDKEKTEEGDTETKEQSGNPLTSDFFRVHCSIQTTLSNVCLSVCFLSPPLPSCLSSTLTERPLRVRMLLLQQQMPWRHICVVEDQIPNSALGRRTR